MGKFIKEFTTIEGLIFLFVFLTPVLTSTDRIFEFLAPRISVSIWSPINITFFLFNFRYFIALFIIYGFGFPIKRQFLLYEADLINSTMAPPPGLKPLSVGYKLLHSELIYWLYQVFYM